MSGNILSGQEPFDALPHVQGAVRALDDVTFDLRAGGDLGLVASRAAGKPPWVPPCCACPTPPAATKGAGCSDGRTGHPSSAGAEIRKNVRWKRAPWCSRGP
jgi:hypothetical protein